jgi:ubiquinone/menaquinone biosynthesis C-methylase UbiE
MNESKQQENRASVRGVEESLRAFYDQEGWKNDGEKSRDAALWEDTRACARDYVSGCRLRLLDHMPRHGGVLLDAASGPLQYPEYLRFSEGYGKRVCVDLSAEALRQAEAKLGPRGEYVKCSILDLPFRNDFADATLSLHTIYHIERGAQEAAVRQLLRVTKPGQPLLVVYANPDRLSSRLARFARSLKGLFKGKAEEGKGEVYYHAHPLAWWMRFSDEATVDIVTWRTLTAKVSRLLIPDNAVGAFLFRTLLWLEGVFPRAMLPLAAYPLIILRKNP